MKTLQNFSHGLSDNAFANVVNGEVQVAAEDPLTGGTPNKDCKTAYKLVAGDDTSISRFGHCSILSGCLSIGKNIAFLIRSLHKYRSMPV